MKIEQLAQIQKLLEKLEGITGKMVIIHREDGRYIILITENTELED